MKQCRNQYHTDCYNSVISYRRAKEAIMRSWQEVVKRPSEGSYDIANGSDKEASRSLFPYWASTCLFFIDSILSFVLPCLLVIRLRPSQWGTSSLVPLKYFSIFPCSSNQNLYFLCSLLLKITFVPLFPSFLDLCSPVPLK